MNPALTALAARQTVQRCVLDPILRGELGAIDVVGPPEAPVAAFATHADYAFLLGDPSRDGASDLAERILHVGFTFIDGPAWERPMTELYGRRLRRLRWTAYDPIDVDFDNLKVILNAARPGLDIRPLDVATINAAIDARRINLGRWWPSVSALIDSGMAFGLFEGDDPDPRSLFSPNIVTASAFQGYISTARAHQRKGFARLIAAHALLRGIERGLSWSWTAGGGGSGELAASLGFKRGASYFAFFVHPKVTHKAMPGQRRATIVRKD